jgi:carbonic anhydrase/acetyltransferase-like protein (isoleucine patch superfamily)
MEDTMSLYSFEGRIPEIAESAYIFENATVIGAVSIGENVWVGPGAVLRGDYGKINVGAYTAVEDNCVIHARPGEQTDIGEHVTLGHASIVHTGRVSDWATLGMGSVVSDFALVGKWAAVGEGCVVKARSEIPDESVAVGVPARVIGKITQEYRDVWTKYKENYNTFCRRYRGNLEKIA